MTGPPLSQGLDPALSDTKYHKILETLSLNRYAIWWFCINVLLLSWETENTSSYDPQPCTEKLGNEARQITKLLQFLGTKWVPCDKGPSRALTDYKGLSSQTIIYFFTCCFWVISISRLLFWNNICNSNKNKFEQDWKFTSHYICWRWGG